MSKNRDLFKEAIAEAKTIRDAALSNAKAVLEEQFTPHLKSMISQKIQEMEEMGNTEEMDEMIDPVNEMDYNMEDENMMSEMEEEIDINELLAEYATEEEEMKESVDEAKKKKEEDTEETKSEKKEEKEEEFDLEDMSEEDLKSFIEDVVKEMVESGEIEETGEKEEEAGEEMPEESESEEIEGLGEIAMKKEDSSIDELLAEIDRDAMKYEVKKLNGKLNEALKINKTLVNELNEINLLNSKLIYVNKIFRSKNLSESQKLQVLKAFDKAGTIKEAKLVFESLSEGLTSKPTQKSSPVIKEHLGGASKSVTTAKISKPVIESNDMIARFQKLAGIK